MYWTFANKSSIVIVLYFWFRLCILTARTSCSLYKTKNLCKNLYLPDKKGEERKIHSILTYQMENNRKGCINRDKNGCKNIRYVFNYYKKTGKRPEKFRREYKLERIASTTETVKWRLSSVLMPEKVFLHHNKKRNRW